MSEIITVSIDQLIPAEWNFKVDGTSEQMATLKASIKADDSCGVMAVRWLEGEPGHEIYEVIDGNHRLQAVKEMGWYTVSVESFGVISRSQAILISKRRNHQWFAIDQGVYDELFKSDIVDEVDTETLDAIMPDQGGIGDDYTHQEQHTQSTPPLDEQWSDDALRTIQVVVPQDVYLMWTQWRDKTFALLGYDSDAAAMELALAEALNIPDESLR